ncbi:MAG: DUF480 domain-containing protein [Micrococcales bacterium]|nr:DUF480 domain-containing protein [Micrococcales bacterium]
MERPVLDPLEQRVLGSLLEKQRTVPASYPLTLNALRGACNQSSSREPVSAYDDLALETAARTLKERGLLRIVWAGKGSRTLKYHQLLSEALDVDDAERTILTVLLLRGPQSAGELRTRCERLHAFADRGDVEVCLERLAARTIPIVAQLQRQPGQHEPRWSHLLGPLPSAGPAASSTGDAATLAIDRDVVLAQGADARDGLVRLAYDTVASTYADRLGEELNAKPFDRWMLERVAELAGAAPVADIGCGPGHLAAFLADTGADVTGFDLSPAMIEQARSDYADVKFEVGDFRRLLRPPRASGWGAIIAWFALAHLAGSELPDAIAGLARTLEAGGHLALAVHIGDEVRHLDSWWEHPVDVSFVLHDPHAVKDAVAAAGLEIVEWYLRGPLLGLEVEIERLYVLARRPA